MILCPGEIFDTSAEPLMPLLNKLVFSCGEPPGDVAGGCILSGGSENVDLQPSTIDDYLFEIVSFAGITFEMFTDQSVDMGGPFGLTVEFSDSVWQVSFNGAFVVTSSQVSVSHLLSFAGC